MISNAFTLKKQYYVWIEKPRQGKSRSSVKDKNYRQNELNSLAG